MIATGKQDENDSSVEERLGDSPSRSRQWFLWIFSIVMIVTAGSAFIFKLIEFTMTFMAEKSIRFAIMPLLTYLIVASGFGCLFIWSILTGQFRDVEKAKYRMLEMQDEIDVTDGVPKTSM